jgi:hypothetical protein
LIGLAGVEGAASGRFFEKKLRKKLLLPTAFEGPYFGRSTARQNQKFFAERFF